MDYRFEENFTTSSLSTQFPLFERIAGFDVPIKIMLGFRNFKISLGKEEGDIVAEYMVNIRVLTVLEESEEIKFSDDFPMHTSVILQLIDDIVYPKINLLSLT